MRITRIVSAFVALVLAVTLTGLVASPAQAAKPKHDATFVPGQAGNGQLFVKGKVSTFPNGTVTIERKDPGGSWTAFKQGDTNGKGKYKVNVDGPSKACFRLVVPKTSDYRKTKVSKGPDGFPLCLQ